MPRKPKAPRTGSTPGPKPSTRAAVRGSGGKVKPPKLSPDARRLWRQLAPELEQSKLLTPRDAVTLGIACEVGAFVQQAAATLHAEGLVTLDAAHRDTERRSPHWVVFQQAAAQWLAYAAHLGLSPKAREGLPAAVRGATPGAGDLLEDFLRQQQQRAAQPAAPVVAEEW